MKILKISEDERQRISNLYLFEQITPEIKSQVNTLINNNGGKAKNYYISHYSKPDVVSKFKNQKNINLLKQFIPTITFKIFKEQGKRNGYVQKTVPNVINVNFTRLFINNGNDIRENGTLFYDTILHEMSHLIQFKLENLGENTIQSSQGYYNPNGGKDDYVNSDVETYARIQRLRSILGLSQNASGQQIKSNFVKLYNNKQITFPNVKLYNGNGNQIIFQPTIAQKGMLTDLWGFYTPIKFNNTSIPDISALFAKFSTVKDRNVYLNLDAIAKIAQTTKGINPQQ